jgi:hypothetical protein
METEKELWCARCGVEITWSPYLQARLMYCCQDCAEGRECLCDYPPDEEESVVGA